MDKETGNALNLNWNPDNRKVNVNDWNPDNPNDDVGERSSVGYFSSLLRKISGVF